MIANVPKDAGIAGVPNGNRLPRKCCVGVGRPVWGGTPHAPLGGLKFCVPQPRLFSTLPHLRHCRSACLTLFLGSLPPSARPPPFRPAPLKSFTPSSGDTLTNPSKPIVYHGLGAAANKDVPKLRYSWPFSRYILGRKVEREHLTL